MPTLQATGLELTARAENRLIALKIVKEPIAFETPVAYAELATMLVRVLGLESIAADAQPQPLGWADGYIHVAQTLELFSGIAGPENYYTQMPGKDAVIMMVNALGYRAAIANASNADEYIAMGTKIGVTKGVGAGLNEGLTRQTAYLMINNSLDIDLLVRQFGSTESYRVEAGRTLALNLQGIQRTEYFRGIVEANSVSSIYAGMETREGEVLIGGETFGEGLTNAGDYVGYNVELYAQYDDNGTWTVTWIKPYRNNFVEVNADDVVECINYTIEYEIGSKNIKQKLNTDTSVIYNYRFAADILKDGKMEPLSGRIILIDNDDDGVTDVIFVTEMQSFIVDTVYSADNLIVLKNGLLAGRRAVELILDDEDYIHAVVDGYDAETEISEIKAGSSISVIASRDFTFVKVILNGSDRIISGKATELSVSERVLHIDSNAYDCAQELSLGDITIGGYAKFYLGADGKIFHIEKDVCEYVYLYQKAKTRSSLSSAVEVRVLGADNSLKTFRTGSRVRIDDVLYTTTDDILNSISTGTAAEIQIGGDGSISAINHLPIYAQRGERAYTEVGSGFNDTENLLLTPFAFEEGLTASFFVPTSGAEEDFSGLFPLFDGEIYVTTGFGFDEAAGCVKAVVVEIDVDMPISSGFRASSEIMAVNSVSSIANEDGAVSYRVRGISGGKEVSYVAAQKQSVFNEISKLQAGDVLRYVLNWNGEIALARQVMTYKLLTNPFYKDLDYANVEIYGKVNTVEKSLLTNYYSYKIHELTLTAGDRGNIKSRVSASLEGRSGTDDKGFNNYFVYDTVLGEFTQGYIDSIIPSELSDEDASTVYVRSENGKVLFIVVFK